MVSVLHLGSQCQQLLILHLLSGSPSSQSQQFLVCIHVRGSGSGSGSGLGGSHVSGMEANASQKAFILLSFQCKRNQLVIPYRDLPPPRYRLHGQGRQLHQLVIIEF
jgi:hypothetical protein